MKKESNINIDNRNYGLDLIRVLATILVITVHFFLNTQYYQTPISGKNMQFQSIIRNFCMACVPLFLLLTGYLNNKKDYNKEFFKGLFNIIIIWLFYSVIEYVTINIIMKTHTNLNFRDLLYNVSSFKGCHYSWYIEMYIGIYLLAPIINRAYDSFDKKSRKIILAIILLLTIIPIFINNVFDNLLHIPIFWSYLYPFAYYIVGKFICDCKPNFNKKNLILLLLFDQIFIFSFQYISINNHDSLPIFIESTLIFLLLYNININNTKLKKVLKYFSSISLGIYLASSLIDTIVYNKFSQIFNFIEIGQRKTILYAPIVLITVFIMSSVYASIRKKLINVR